MTIAVSGVSATPAQLSKLRSDLLAGTGRAGNVTHIGESLTRYRYSGAQIDFALAADGGPNVVTFPSTPADAVGIEVWLNANGSTDYLFMAMVGGRLANVANLANNVAANLAACRYVTSGAHMVIPFVTKGTNPSTLRFATGNASSRIQGRFISDASMFPYLTGSTTEFVLTGAGASQQLPYTDTGRFPAGYVGTVLQVLGSGVARFTIDGTVPTATVGDILVPGTYVIDTLATGIALSALRIYLPTGTNVVGHSLMAAA